MLTAGGTADGRRGLFCPALKRLRAGLRAVRAAVGSAGPERGPVRCARSPAVRLNGDRRPSVTAGCAGKKRRGMEMLRRTEMLCLPAAASSERHGRP